MSRLFTAYGLKDGDLYFLDLIPLVEMVWAEGHNQEAELRILEAFARRHMEELNGLLGYQAVTERDLENFMDRFARRRPPQALLAKLRTIACHRVRRRSSGEMADKAGRILEYCIDIAAACVTRYPYSLRERIMEGERRLLGELLPLLQGQSGS
ncbi:hypothetical protein [Methylomarinovum caldicuralii]|uniref:hypothetical protein n=1 Tax=Methylomarinovum caldicuralii TaxID=438856 RepID=UPI002953CE62|nr:hypothetical protein [Methylomarinovum caldicuralii]